MNDTIIKAGQFYIYTQPDGQQQRLNSLAEAMNAARYWTTNKFSKVN